MEELTFNDLPKAVSQLLLEIKEIKELLKHCNHQSRQISRF